MNQQAFIKHLLGTQPGLDTVQKKIKNETIPAPKLLSSGEQKEGNMERGDGMHYIEPTVCQALG